MTFRERIADWISGGALTRARADAIFERDLQKKYYRIATAANLKQAEAEEKGFWLQVSIRDIFNATRNGKSGTARKINRMAREALK